ncbi:winged helix-turn-helix transcriptional regulator [Microbacterium esteraromaticum]|uniref:Winged helix-turn-helix transcriptional regulator n=1 Tax=Microbacterium esteraromaticum TaxID=57043 RepID=A0A7D8AA74_9MICO|nr:winged helix-turn-helix domain-containing protein [Microbacterium esteraromaticum]QMU97900.1 winged helix-turn-helix transcriptional regulator [Microbacterium esteraromaticum]
MRIEITEQGAPPAEQVYGQLRGLITSGQLAADERLPSVRRLASDLGIAAGTVAKAYRHLESDGLVVSRTGAGTRVSRSATPVSQNVARAARALASAARREGLSAEDAVRILRAVW